MTIRERRSFAFCPAGRISRSSRHTRSITSSRSRGRTPCDALMTTWQWPASRLKDPLPQPVDQHAVGHVEHRAVEPEVNRRDRGRSEPGRPLDLGQCRQRFRPKQPGHAMPRHGERPRSRTRGGCRRRARRPGRCGSRRRFRSARPASGDGFRPRARRATRRPDGRTSPQAASGE